ADCASVEPTSSGGPVGTPQATTLSAISARPVASRSNTPARWKRSISSTTRPGSTSPARRSWTSGAPASAARRRCPSPRPIPACSSRRRSEPLALFEYFPNYIWNLSVAIAMESGGRIGEIVDMCEPIRKAAENGDAGTPDFMRRWAGKGRELLELAEEDEAKCRAFSASNKLERASLYLFVAERMQAHGSEGRKETYALAREAFDRSTRLGGINRERVEIPLESGTMPALLTRAPGEGPRPCVVYCNGLDSCKELLYWTRLPEELARRGVSTLCVDQPGSGEALRFQGLPVDPHSESWASQAVDWLEGQGDIDAARIGMTGISLGGHFAPRAVAYEPRFVSGAVWGANHNWREVQDKRIAREG